MSNVQESKVRMVDVDGVAAYLSLSPHTIRDWVKKGRIPFVKLGRAVRFDLKELESWVESKKVPQVLHCLSSFSLVDFDYEIDFSRRNYERI